MAPDGAIAMTPAQLALAYRPLALRIAYRQSAAVPQLLEELRGAALLGLVEAASRARPGRGLTSYLTWRIRGAVVDEIRRHHHLKPHHHRELLARGQELPEAPLSLSALSEDGVPQRPAAKPVRDARWPCVRAALRALSGPERRALVLTYGRGLTLREAGLAMGFSESGVCRVRARALAKARRAAEAALRRPMAMPR